MSEKRLSVRTCMKAALSVYKKLRMKGTGFTYIKTDLDSPDKIGILLANGAYETFIMEGILHGKSKGVFKRESIH